MTQQEFKDYIIDRDCFLTKEDCLFLMKDSHFVRGMMRLTQEGITPSQYEITFEDFSVLRFKTAH